MRYELPHTLPSMRRWRRRIPDGAIHLRNKHLMPATLDEDHPDRLDADLARREHPVILSCIDPSRLD
jgi:hypothetical protein